MVLTHEAAGNMKRFSYFDMPLEKRLPLTAAICAALAIIPPIVAGLVFDWPKKYYQDVLLIYGFVLFLSFLGWLNEAVNHKESYQRMYSDFEPSERPLQKLCNWLWYVSVLLALLWGVGLLEIILGLVK